MTFDLVLSSLLYHGREWFVFQDILTHLPQEKAAAATQHSKTTQKYTYRFGITRDWVTGDSKKVLVDRHFIDSNDPERALVFSSVLIDAERVQELFLEGFNKRFRLKVQQFHLTATSLDSTWFEWQFDPKQKDGCAVKKTKLTVHQNDCPSSKAQEKTHQNNQNSDSENMTPNLSSNESPQTTQASKRRRHMENGDQSGGDYTPSISESVLMRPRKKAKEANLSISKYLDQREDEKPDTMSMQQKEEPMSPDYKPDMANFHNIKRSLSPMDKPKIELSPSSSQTIVKEDVLLSSTRDSNADSDSDYIPPSNDTTPESNAMSQESNTNSQNSDNMNESDVTDLASSMSQHSTALDDQDMPDVGNLPDGNNISADTGNGADNVVNVQQNVSDKNSIIDCNNGKDSRSGSRSSTEESNIPDTNVPDDVNLSSQTEPISPTSSLLDNSNNIMENIILQKKELCTEEEDLVVVEGQSSEVPSTSADTRVPAETHKHDCGAEACSSNGASSTVCLCTNEEKATQETAATRVESSGASALLDGLKALGFLPLVRQLLENDQGDTRLSQMDADLTTLENQINQKKKANRQLQKNIKKKAGELEKLFDSLRKGKANCELLEKKHKDLQAEKASIEEKVKKCLEVLSSVD